jgi:hypothetical protein
MHGALDRFRFPVEPLLGRAPPAGSSIDRRQPDDRSPLPGQFLFGAKPYMSYGAAGRSRRIL